MDVNRGCVFRVYARTRALAVKSGALYFPCAWQFARNQDWYPRQHAGPMLHGHLAAAIRAWVRDSTSSRVLKTNTSTPSAAAASACSLPAPST